MLEHYFTLPAILRGHREGPLGPYLDAFVAKLEDLGYTRHTVRVQCCAVRDLGRWLTQRGLELADLGDERVTEYLRDRRRRGRFMAQGGRVIRLLVEHLQQEGIVGTSQREYVESPLDRVVGRFSAHLETERGLEQATINNYVPYARRFLAERFAGKPLRLAQLATSDVSGFVVRWAHSQSPGRAKLMVTSLRSFFRFLLANGEIDVDLAVAVPSVADWRQTTVPKHLSKEEVESVLATCDRRTTHGRRNYALLLLLARLGLRAGEVVALELDDIDWRAGEVMVRGKGSFHDRMPLLADVGAAIADYLRDRPRCSTRRVFVRARAPYRGFHDSTAVATIVKRALARAGLKPPTRGAHLLRHSLATGMLRAGASMAEVGQVLRHRSPNTTEIYAKVDVHALRSLAQPWPRAEDGQ